MSSAPITRRQSLRRGIGGAAAVVVPAGLLGAEPALADADSDALTKLCELEQASAFAYEAAAKSGKLDDAATELFESYAEQEGEHVTAWSSALDQLSVDPPASPVSAADSSYLEGLDAASTQDDYVDFMIELEQELAATYQDQAVALTIEDLIRTGAQVVANHSQHLVALRDLRGDAPGELAAA